MRESGVWEKDKDHAITTQKQKEGKIKEKNRLESGPSTMGENRRAESECAILRCALSCGLILIVFNCERSHVKRGREREREGINSRCHGIEKECDLPSTRL
jgi:hypothetical protein